jgi:hypothetical protein
VRFFEGSIELPLSLVIRFPETEDVGSEGDEDGL